MPDPNSTFELVVADPDKTRFEGDVTRLIAPGINQDIAILPDHTPLYAQLKPGTLTITKENNQEETVKIEGGIIRVRNNKASVVVGFDVKTEAEKPTTSN